MCEFREGYWYCPNCDVELLPESVTYEENCDFCGEPAEWIKTPLCGKKFEECITDEDYDNAMFEKDCVR